MLLYVCLFHILESGNVWNTTGVAHAALLRRLPWGNDPMRVRSRSRRILDHFSCHFNQYEVPLVSIARCGNYASVRLLACRWRPKLNCILRVQRQLMCSASLFDNTN
jgi:hypothetical protein